jgi:hypothetical protein
MLYAAHLALFVVVFLPVWAINRFTGKFEWLNAKLSSYFLWNGMIRVFMLTFLDLFLAAVLNTNKAAWGSTNPVEELSNRISI